MTGRKLPGQQIFTPFIDRFRTGKPLGHLHHRAVLRPGVYRLPPDTRVYQAVEQAGGLTSEADPEAFNMALPLEDGIHIHVPRKGEGPGPR